MTLDQKHQDFLMIIAIFIIGFLIRLINLKYALFPDELIWIVRSRKFFQALIDWKPSRTFITAHPGVTTMFFAGLVLYYLPNTLDVLTYVRLPFCIFGAASCSLVYLIGKSMFNRERGLIAALMLTFEPFYIGITRIIHLDGLLTFFFTLTLYFFWLGITQKKQKYIILCGISLGLTALTKSPAIFLIPILLVWIFLLKNSTELNSRQSIWFLMIVFLSSVLTFFILWPGIWDLTRFFDNIEFALLAYGPTYSGHETEIFFLGYNSRAPPFYFYPIILILRLSTGTLICLIISLILYAHRLRKNDLVLEETLFLLATIIFIVGLSLIGKKADRYLIPIWPILILTSSSGFQTILNSSREFFNSFGYFKNKQLVPKLIIGFVIVLPAALWNFRYQPFYVFYFNDFTGGLKGGSKLSTTYTSEGSRLVAEYLSNKSNSLAIACPYAPGTLDYFYEGGRVTPLPGTIDLLYRHYDYVVFHLTWVQRWGNGNTIWLHFQEKNPEWTIIVQGVIIIWVFNV